MRFSRTWTSSASVRRPGALNSSACLPTGSAKTYPFEDMHDACHRIIAAYSPDRCLWGSAFPCELWCPKVTYNEHLRLITEALGLTEGEKQAVLAETPGRLWFDGR